MIRKDFQLKRIKLSVTYFFTMSLKYSRLQKCNKLNKYLVITVQTIPIMTLILFQCIHKQKNSRKYKGILVRSSWKGKRNIIKNQLKSRGFRIVKQYVVVMTFIFTYHSENYNCIYFCNFLLILFILLLNGLKRQEKQRRKGGWFRLTWLPNSWYAETNKIQLMAERRSSTNKWKIFWQK